LIFEAEFLFRIECLWASEFSCLQKRQFVDSINDSQEKPMPRYQDNGKILVCFFLTFGSLLLPEIATKLQAEDTWLQWRGPNRTGIVADKVWPDSLAEDTLKSSWRISLSPSYSGPLVTTDRIFVTETRGERDEAVKAIDRRTGKEIWSTKWQGAITVPFFAGANGSWIRSTPTLDGNDLFVAGIRDVLVCLDAKSGKTNWRVDFADKLKSSLPSFGCVCSPLVDEDYVYIQAGGGFVKLDRKTGKILWRTLEDGGGMSGGAFSSPVIAKIAGRRQALVQTRKRLAGVDLESGKQLWSIAIEAFRGMNILTPAVIGNKIFTSTYGGGSFLFEVARNETRQFTVKQIWRNKVQGYMSSPVVIDNHIYLHLRNQRFACIDIATGKETWITQPFGKYWSLIASKDQILALDERGELFLIRANPKKFDLVDQRKISNDPTWAHIALVDDEIVIRELQGLVSLKWRAKKQ
jgi:outer membrane protein assembly factor BamB